MDSLEELGRQLKEAREALGLDQDALGTAVHEAAGAPETPTVETVRKRISNAERGKPDGAQFFVRNDELARELLRRLGVPAPEGWLQRWKVARQATVVPSIVFDADALRGDAGWVSAAELVRATDGVGCAEVVCVGTANVKYETVVAVKDVLRLVEVADADAASAKLVEACKAGRLAVTNSPMPDWELWAEVRSTSPFGLFPADAVATFATDGRLPSLPQPWRPLSHENPLGPFPPHDDSRRPLASRSMSEREEAFQLCAPRVRWRSEAFVGRDHDFQRFNYPPAERLRRAAELGCSASASLEEVLRRHVHRVKPDELLKQDLKARVGLVVDEVVEADDRAIALNPSDATLAAVDGFPALEVRAYATASVVSDLDAHLQTLTWADLLSCEREHVVAPFLARAENAVEAAGARPGDSAGFGTPAHARDVIEEVRRRMYAAYDKHVAPFVSWRDRAGGTAVPDSRPLLACQDPIADFASTARKVLERGIPRTADSSDAVRAALVGILSAIRGQRLTVLPDSVYILMGGGMYADVVVGRASLEHDPGFRVFAETGRITSYVEFRPGRLLLHAGTTVAYVRFGHSFLLGAPDLAVFATEEADRWEKHHRYDD